MNGPSYEVGQLAALAVRLALSSGLSCEEARAAFGLASRMLAEETSAPIGAPGAAALAAGQHAKAGHKSSPPTHN